jgi:hypothetical protein
MSNWQYLLNHKKFENFEAAMLADTDVADPYGDNTVLRARFYESWGDLLSLDFTTGATEKYSEALRGWQLFASWSTSGGEGTARMRDVNRVLAKIEAL